MTLQVGRHGRAVFEVAADLGCERHTVNDAVVAYGIVLVDDPDGSALGRGRSMDHRPTAKPHVVHNVTIKPVMYGILVIVYSRGGHRWCTRCPVSVTGSKATERP